MINEMIPQNLEEYITLTAKLDGITDIDITSEVSGKVVEIKKQLGDWVNKGEEIGNIDNTDYRIRLEQAEANMLSSEAALSGAQMQLNASENLYEKEIVSELEYSQAVSGFKSAQAAYKGAKAGLEQAQKAYDNSRFVAPLSGYIASMHLEIGQTVNMGSPICSIVNNKQLRIKSGIGENQIQLIKKGQKVFVSYNSDQLVTEGIVTGIGIRPAANSANYPIEIELSNPDMKLYPGMVVEVRILSNIYENVLYTSLNNVLQQYDTRYVYVIDSDNQAEKRIVKLGNVVSENVILEEGIDAGDLLVIEGAENLEDNSFVDIRKQIR